MKTVVSFMYMLLYVINLLPGHNKRHIPLKMGNRSKFEDIWLCKFVLQINLSSEVKGILSLPSEQRTPEQVQTVCL